MAKPNAVRNTWKEGRASEQCAKCGMVFTIMRHDCLDEVTARQRLLAAVKQHGGCEQRLDESQNAVRIVREATENH
jgi:hypothetical protein